MKCLELRVRWPLLLLNRLRNDEAVRLIPPSVAEAGTLRDG